MQEENPKNSYLIRDFSTFIYSVFFSYANASSERGFESLLDFLNEPPGQGFVIETWILRRLNPLESNSDLYSKFRLCTLSLVLSYLITFALKVNVSCDALNRCY